MRNSKRQEFYGVVCVIIRFDAVRIHGWDVDRITLYYAMIDPIDVHHSYAMSKVEDVRSSVDV